MESKENEAKKLAATYARWLRNPDEALFGKTGKGVVMQIYNSVKQAKTKDELMQILDLSKYELSKQTFNDMTRFINELRNKISQMTDQDAINFTIEVMRYFQISLFTKIEDMRRGLWA
ncbi:hypothetical protein [Metallosphaera hakonensis]|uniref:CRISPR type III-B/RAMP module-associated protein Cmr5 n=1 Tax=Metallosphaera hakonensis JCM 8857 = DSM 7519 TaxID=1293036 RepID=A0A2U9IVM6_9CREN|nr:hypothetical protein [Metallosphaera hakonensis]AWS00107.1 hypothetical protein DFR87_10910 [Metallosphaera hakonensis JCM 8857 = DSM 7519]